MLGHVGSGQRKIFEPNCRARDRFTDSRSAAMTRAVQYRTGICNRKCCTRGAADHLRLVFEARLVGRPIGGAEGSQLDRLSRWYMGCSLSGRR